MNAFDVIRLNIIFIFTLNLSTPIVKFKLTFEFKI
jgi:hypothetical protein